MPSSRTPAVRIPETLRSASSRRSSRRTQGPTARGAAPVLDRLARSPPVEDGRTRWGAAAEEHHKDQRPGDLPANNAPYAGAVEGGSIDDAKVRLCASWHLKRLRNSSSRCSIGVEPGRRAEQDADAENGEERGQVRLSEDSAARGEAAAMTAAVRAPINNISVRIVPAVRSSGPCAPRGHRRAQGR